MYLLYTDFSLYCHYILFCQHLQQAAFLTQYLEQAGLGGDHQDIGVGVVLGNRQQLLCGSGCSELERSAGPTDVSRMGHITELVELSI